MNLNEKIQLRSSKCTTEHLKGVLLVKDSSKVHSLVWKKRHYLG